jgi:hypothetical protein
LANSIEGLHVYSSCRIGFRPGQKPPRIIDQSGQCPVPAALVRRSDLADAYLKGHLNDVSGHSCRGGHAADRFCPQPRLSGDERRCALRLRIREQGDGRAGLRRSSDVRDRRPHAQLDRHQRRDRAVRRHDFRYAVFLPWHRTDLHRRLYPGRSRSARRPTRDHTLEPRATCRRGSQK